MTSSTHIRQLQEAALQGERLRTMAALTLIAVLSVVSLASSIFDQRVSVVGLLVNLSIPPVLAAIEVGFFLGISRIQRRRGSVPAWLIALGTTVEANLPTAGIVLLTLGPVVGPFKALTTPVVLVYFLFIILSSLRLRPWTSVLCGTMASFGYLVATTLTYAMFPEKRMLAEDGLRPFIMTGATLMLAGLLAALISRQVLRHVSSAIQASQERAKLASDMAIAGAIQKSLLPANPPEFPGFDVFGHSDPADETGGDYYSWYVLPDGRLAVVLADVAGHGLGPALLAVGLHAYVRAVAPEGNDGRQWMTQLNSHVSGDLTEGRFITFVGVVLDRRDGRVHMLSAGHGPILLYRSRDGKVVKLGSHGPPLGVIDDFQYKEQQSLELQVGDVLAIFTDGFVEWYGPADEQFGTERLAEALKRHSSMSCHEIVDAIRRELADFVCGTAQTDDVTAVLVKRIR